jgi:hypothetical protein
VQVVKDRGRQKAAPKKQLKERSNSRSAYDSGAGQSKTGLEIRRRRRVAEAKRIAVSHAWHQPELHALTV